MCRIHFQALCLPPANARIPDNTLPHPWWLDNGSKNEINSRIANHSSDGRLAVKFMIRKFISSKRRTNARRKNTFLSLAQVLAGRQRSKPKTGRAHDSSDGKLLFHNDGGLIRRFRTEGKTKNRAARRAYDSSDGSIGVKIFVKKINKISPDATFLAGRRKAEPITVRANPTEIDLCKKY